MPRLNFLAHISKAWLIWMLEKYLDGLNRSVNPGIMILNVLERNQRDSGPPAMELEQEIFKLNRNYAWFTGLFSFLAAWVSLIAAYHYELTGFARLHLVNKFAIILRIKLAFSCSQTATIWFKTFPDFSEFLSRFNVTRLRHFSYMRPGYLWLEVFCLENTNHWQCWYLFVAAPINHGKVVL